ncbi:MAG: ATP-dependent RecD-like DNA helicase [Oscillospiraceae bacterium]|nr:ATP-dependent RecD-like DNA helicase [Oscillospiraceae bacterium]
MDEEKETNAVAGTVTAVIFRNEENGYTILRLDAGEAGEITAVGCMPGVAPGETLEAEGRWMKHAAYGEQFKVETLHRHMPVGTKAIFEYLSSRAVKGIGAKTAKKLIDAFGEDTLKVIEEDPQQLVLRLGFSPKKAAAVHDALVRQAGMRLLIEFLGQYQLSASLAVPLYRRFGPTAIEMVRENPYLLSEEDVGLSFSAADQLAIDLGFAGDDPRRLEAGLLFELRHNLSNGHTFLPRNKLTAATQKLLHLEEGSMEQALDALLDQGEVVQEQVAGQPACYLTELYDAEVYVAFRLEEMTQAEFQPPDNLERLLLNIQREQGIEYAPHQEQAVRLAACRQVMLLTGGPGTGKTTSLRGVLALFQALGLETALAAPTGRAAKRLGELCGQEGSTIHRLLETRFDPDTGQLAFAHNQENPLPCDAVIVDETSMVDVPLMQALLCALRGDCRLVLVGDPEQLPSVGPGNLLSDLLHSGRIPSVRLTEVFRQAAESAIVCTAHAINRGTPPAWDNKSKDFFFLRRYDPERTAETIVELVARRINKKKSIPAGQIQVLSPTRKYTTGTANLNRLLQQALNPPAQGKPERRFGEMVFRKGDRVMQVRNNYDVMWQDERGKAGLGMFNGDIGCIRDIDEAGQLTVDFEGKLVEYTPDMLSELELAYAITVHKAQGSEYRAVVLAMLDGAPVLMTRGVLYTAVTRARELLVLVGDENTAAAMTANDRQQRRYSGLYTRLVHPQSL